MSLVGLIDHLRAAFAARELLPIEIVEGREALNEQLNYGVGGRIAIYDVEEPGSVAPPMRIGDDGDDRRELWTITTPLGVSIVGYDAELPSRYFAHRDRALAVWELLAQEVQRLCPGAHSWASWGWNTKRKHGAHGAELNATLFVELVLRDVASDSAFARPRPGAPKPADEEP